MDLLYECEKFEFDLQCKTIDNIVWVHQPTSVVAQNY